MTVVEMGPVRRQGLDGLADLRPPAEVRSFSRSRPLLSMSDGPVMRRLSGASGLSQVEIDLIRGLAVYRQNISVGQALGGGGRPLGPRILVSGWACRQRTLTDGRRQIFGFLIPGDTIGLNTLHRPLDDLAIVALTRVECVDALILRELLLAGDERHARLNRALLTCRKEEDACLLDQIVRLGRQSAMERLAHFLLEMRDRCAAAGLLSGDSFPLPLTQEVLADALGLSIVHLNRTLQQMKRSMLISMKGGRVTLLDSRELGVIADYGCHDG